MRLKSFAAFGLAGLLLAGCGNQGSGNRIKIGLSLDTLKEERWQHDRDLFVAKCKTLGVDVLVQAANSDDALQNSQAENLLTEGVNVLVVVPHNGKSAATIVESAHKAGVPVLAYDRLINDCDLDLYVSFDNVKVGEMQADYLVKHQPKGNYVLIGGAPTDHNALMFRQGQMNILKPYVDRGDIKVVADQWATDWQAVEALKITENALTKNNNKVDAVLVSNDGTAGGAIQALSEQNLAGKVWVSGQDADLAACQRIVAGTQSMTVYKPIQKLAEKAAELAVALAQKQPLTDKTSMVNNGKKDVPSILLEPIEVDKDNLDATVIADGYQKKEDVYKK
ncbi:MAG TPA: D-xylose ABC transporter substrate-binding protein [bacterium]|jgi:D-xylose transport system substrate-binding protein|nr:D-xylose ABC transporter substrate-binding protein [bacterium]